MNSHKDAAISQRKDDEEALRELGKEMMMQLSGSSKM